MGSGGGRTLGYVQEKRGSIELRGRTGTSSDCREPPRASIRASKSQGTFCKGVHGSRAHGSRPPLLSGPGPAMARRGPRPPREAASPRRDPFVTPLRLDPP